MSRDVLKELLPHNTEKLISPTTAKPRLSLLKAFDPCYESPAKSQGSAALKNSTKTDENQLPSSNFPLVILEDEMGEPMDLDESQSYHEAMDITYNATEQKLEEIPDEIFTSVQENPSLSTDLNKTFNGSDNLNLTAEKSPASSTRIIENDVSQLQVPQINILPATPIKDKTELEIVSEVKIIPPTPVKGEYVDLEGNPTQSTNGIDGEQLIAVSHIQTIEEGLVKVDQQPIALQTSQTLDNSPQNQWNPNPQELHDNASIEPKELEENANVTQVIEETGQKQMNSTIVLEDRSGGVKSQEVFDGTPVKQQEIGEKVLTEDESPKELNSTIVIAANKADETISVTENVSSNVMNTTVSLEEKPIVANTPKIFDETPIQSMESDEKSSAVEVLKQQSVLINSQGIFDETPIQPKKNEGNQQRIDDVSTKVEKSNELLEEPLIQKLSQEVAIQSQKMEEKISTEEQPIAQKSLNDLEEQPITANSAKTCDDISKKFEDPTLLPSSGIQNIEVLSPKEAPTNLVDCQPIQLKKIEGMPPAVVAGQVNDARIVEEACQKEANTEMVDIQTTQLKKTDVASLVVEEQLKETKTSEEVCQNDVGTKLVDIQATQLKKTEDVASQIVAGQSKDAKIIEVHQKESTKLVDCSPIQLKKTGDVAPLVVDEQLKGTKTSEEVCQKDASTELVDIQATQVKKTEHVASPIVAGQPRNGKTIEEVHQKEATTKLVDCSPIQLKKTGDVAPLMEWNGTKTSEEVCQKDASIKLVDSPPVVAGQLKDAKASEEVCQNEISTKLVDKPIKSQKIEEKSLPVEDIQGSDKESPVQCHQCSHSIKPEIVERVVYKTDPKLIEENKRLLQKIENYKCRDKQLQSTLETYEAQYQYQMDEFVKTSSKSKDEYDTMQKHLATLEMAFSDVHQKYERSKTVLEGYRNNEKTLKESLAFVENKLMESQKECVQLKEQLNEKVKACTTLVKTERDKMRAELNKYISVSKRLEIKVNSLTSSLEQKTKECSDMAKLLDEMTQ